MKCLTVCQPYADLILLPDSNPDAKRVENRTWPTAHRGPLLIHAGKSTSWLGMTKAEAKRIHPRMAFGAIIGVAEVVDCVKIGAIRGGQFDHIHPWLKLHKHTGGPWCIVLQNPRRFSKPIPYSGKLGVFPVPDEIVKGEMN